ncbi:ABC transporter component [Rhodospirillum rubrum ATCC 11170]|uniref:ABC transporter component n=1 Tax=Rhodospirillum rubrum (strain ATCC 11170 / ATH 1.1.1 / DSM 467 / LMG 4362 / NCIMB 8255 / S1) TaxID=269796 RepID=Q2RP50_RHORT|nr:ABC transporter component [Rhodospirillum rubrum ATCC 11170]MBK5955780.1 glycosyl transferase family 1 [Rhodospirillum rubrum]HAP99706.1 ABC transporter ATP-binding protein/permease [Rhodospirillum rubrum]
MAIPDPSPRPSPEPVKADTDALWPQVRSMARAFWKSPARNRLIFLGGGLATVIALTAFGQMWLNAWNQPFYDSLARKDMDGFIHQLWVFAGIAFLLLTLNVSQTWLNQSTKVKLREGLVRDLLDDWLQGRRAFRLAFNSEIGVNPDQRIHEDARHLSELTTDLGIGLLQASLLLATFIGVLWGLSRGIVLHIDGQVLAIPGYMVWCALLYAGIASLLSWKVGSPLVRLNALRYAREADLRFNLVRVSEHMEGIALHGGEADERDRLSSDLDRVLGIMRRIVGAVTGLTWITAGYGWFTLVAPILVAAPGYFHGNLSFGELMMAVGAFIQVQQALRWFIDNVSAIADWRATLLRVSSFREGLQAMDRLGEGRGRIDFAPSTDRQVILSGLEVASPAGAISLSQPEVVIEPGQHLLIIGDSGTGKTVFFRAIAGLWPWGKGRIGLPPDDDLQDREGDGVMFLPRHPYIPPGTLRAAISYPQAADDFDDWALVEALGSMGLAHLAARLNRSARWDKELTDDERRCLAFARVALRKPKVVIMDEAFDVLDDASLGRAMAIFREKLRKTIVITIGRPEVRDHFFDQVLRLSLDPAGPRFLPDDHATGDADRDAPTAGDDEEGLSVRAVPKESSL